MGTITDESDVTIFEASVDGGAFRSVLGQIQNDTYHIDQNRFWTVWPRVARSPKARTRSRCVRPMNSEMPRSDVVVTFTFIPNNMAPTVATIPNQTATEDSAFTFNVGSSFNDPNAGDVLRFSSSNLPSWLSMNATTGVLSGTPANANVGTANVTVRATDAFGLFVDGTVQITVNNVNDAPTVSIPNQTATVDVPFSVRPDGLHRRRGRGGHV